MIEEAFAKWLQGTAQPAFSPREIRLSETGACPRKRVLRVLGYPGRPPTEDELAVFAEGRVMEDFLAAMLTEVGWGPVVRQHPVRVALDGIPPFAGHIDILLPKVPPFPLVVECKTVHRNAAAFGLPRQEHVLQLMSYLHFGGYPAGEIVYFLKGRRMELRSFLVRYRPEVGQAIEADLRDLWERVEREDPPPVPAGYERDRYPCYWQNVSEKTEHYCEMWDRCWPSEAEAPAPIPADHVADDVRRFAQLRLDYSRLLSQADELKEQMRPLEERLAAALGRRSGVLEVPGVRVKGALCKPVPRYAVEEAIRAGVVSEEALAPYRQVGEPYWRWSVFISK